MKFEQLFSLELSGYTLEIIPVFDFPRAGVNVLPWKRDDPFSARIPLQIYAQVLQKFAICL